MRLPDFFGVICFFFDRQKILGMNRPWRGGDDMANGFGGGYKVNLLREFLADHKEDKTKRIMFVDSYDVVLTGTPSAIGKAFKNSGYRILFGAEPYCWPDSSVAVSLKKQKKTTF